jgi:hypothetical protein
VKGLGEWELECRGGEIVLDMFLSLESHQALLRLIFPRPGRPPDPTASLPLPALQKYMCRTADDLIARRLANNDVAPGQGDWFETWT